MNETHSSEEELSGKKPIAYPLSPQRLLNIGRETFQDRAENLALWSILYLTAGRVSEIVGNRDTGRLGLQRQDLINERTEKLFRIRILTEKNRIAPVRYITIPYGDACPTEREMLKDFTNYVKETTTNEPIFNDITRQMAYNRIAQAKADLEAIENTDVKTRKPIILPNQPINPHFLRHCRLTHLVELYGFDAGRLTIFAGWTSFKPAKTYVHLDWKALSKPFLEKESAIHQPQQINTTSTQKESSGASQE